MCFYDREHKVAIRVIHSYMKQMIGSSVPIAFNRIVTNMPPIQLSVIHIRSELCSAIIVELIGARFIIDRYCDGVIISAKKVVVCSELNDESYRG